MAAVLSSMWALSSRSGFVGCVSGGAVSGGGVSGGGVFVRCVLCCVVSMVIPTTPFGVHILVSIDPREPSNIDAFAAAEFTQAAAHKFCVNLGAL